MRMAANIRAQDGDEIDATLTETLFEPWRGFLEWQLAEGELVDNSLKVLRELLSMQPRDFRRRRDAPPMFSRAISDALAAAKGATGLSEADISARWTEKTIPLWLSPALQQLERDRASKQVAAAHFS